MSIENRETTQVGEGIREAGRKMSHIAEHAGNKSDNLLHNAGDFIEKYQNEISEYSEALLKYVKDNPLKSAVVVGGVGLMLGYLLKRR